jgi:hypothetical protein
VRMKHDDNPNWKEEPTRRLAVAPDWESRMFFFFNLALTAGTRVIPELEAICHDRHDT